MILQYHKAPLYLLDDVPAGKAGEWPGIKSNHFTPTRKIIRSINKETVFNNDYLPIFGRKHFKIVRSKEHVFRPCIRVGNPNKPTNENGDDLFPAKLNLDAKKISMKKNYFKTREEYTKSLSEKLENKDKIVAKEDLNFLQDLGFNKEEYSKFLHESNRKKIDIANDFHLNYSKKKEEEKLINLKMEQENFKRDVDYVKLLDDWEKTVVLPIIDTKK